MDTIFFNYLTALMSWNWNEEKRLKTPKGQLQPEAIKFLLLRLYLGGFEWYNNK